MNHNKFKTSPRSQRIIKLHNIAEKLIPLGHTVSLPANKFFIHSDQKLEYLYVVKSGMAVGCEYYPNGIVREGLIMAKNSIIGEAFLIMDEPSPIPFKTVVPSEIVLISRQDFFHLLNEDTELNHLIMESLAKKFLSSMDEVRQMAFYNVTWRICNLLVIFGEHYGVEENGKIKIDIPLSHHIISKLLCVNRITIVRTMKKLKEQNLLEYHEGHYYICNLESLLAYRKQNDVS